MVYTYVKTQSSSPTGTRYLAPGTLDCNYVLTVQKLSYSVIVLVPYRPRARAAEQLQLIDTSDCPAITCRIDRLKMRPTCVGFAGTTRLGVT
jgi:hypothetical protein